MKTNKAYRKRLKITRSGKILTRRAGQNHFNAKESGNVTRRKRSMAPMSMKNKAKSRFLSNLL
jgi:ribosomal protein L35